MSASISKDFPPSTAVPSKYFHWPGISDESTVAVRHLLEENDRHYDIYEKARFAHNHSPHSILTRYAFGAPTKLLNDTWDHDRPHLATLDPEADHRKTGDLSRLPGKITTENWDDPKTLGFKDAYAPYIAFFHAEVARLGPLGAINEYVLSSHANWESKNGHAAPQMLVRMIAGVLHPFIHTGFGLEFRDKVVLAEGLAEAAVHDHGIMTKLFPEDWPKSLLEPSAGSAPKEERDDWGDAIFTNNGPGLLEIFAEMQRDNGLQPVEYDSKMMINDRLEAAVGGNHGQRLLKLLDRYDLSDTALRAGPGGWESKLKEIGVLVTLLACATGRKNHQPRIDFFLMHALTSSIFLPAYMDVLGPPARRAILTTYLAGILATTIARGSPHIDIEYLMSAPLHPVGPGTTPSKSNGHCLSNVSDNTTRNAWLGIVESSLYATDSHVPKSIRPLVHYSTLMGTASKGSLPGTMTSNGEAAMPGSEKLDGTMFVRAAGLVMEVMGWCREGQKAGHWEMSPIGYDEVWK